MCSNILYTVVLLLQDTHKADYQPGVAGKGRVVGHALSKINGIWKQYKLSLKTALSA